MNRSAATKYGGRRRSHHRISHEAVYREDEASVYQHGDISRTYTSSSKIKLCEVEWCCFGWLALGVVVLVVVLDTHFYIGYSTQNSYVGSTQFCTENESSQMEVKYRGNPIRVGLPIM